MLITHDLFEGDISVPKKGTREWGMATIPAKLDHSPEHDRLCPSNGQPTTHLIFPLTAQKAFGTRKPLVQDLPRKARLMLRVPEEGAKQRRQDLSGSAR